MHTVALFSHKPDTINLISNYLKKHNYKNISINYNDLEITAEHGGFFSGKNKFYFKIVYVNSTITNIIIKVNPQNDPPAPDDLQKEIKLADTFYAHF